jgi:ATP-dependent phosphofructokinase / diphosphate-dependent phosphofructokinase
MRIGILTGGGDVPGLNPCIKSVVNRVIYDGHEVIGIRRGWAGLLECQPDVPESVQACTMPLDLERVRTIDRYGGTTLHTSRTNPGRVRPEEVPDFLADKAAPEGTSDFTPHVLHVLDKLGIDALIPIGGDDTLSYAKHLHDRGVNIVGVPKTMDNDVAGTDYCIGFSTCVTRTIELTHRLRTSAGSHERFLVIEVFGRYAGFTALLPAMAGAADRCVIPEFPFSVERLTELLVEDRNKNPSRYSVVLVSEGATFAAPGAGMHFESDEADQYGHRKLGGIGDRVADALKELSPKYNRGRRINVVNQRLGYLVRSGDPDALDSIVPMAFGNIALDLILEGRYGRLVSIHKGSYDSVPIERVTDEKKLVDVAKYYNPERLRPSYKSFYGRPLFIMTSDA